MSSFDTSGGAEGPMPIPTSPPREVMEAVDAAHRAYDRLAAGGRSLQFDLDPHTGRLCISAVDRKGTQLGEVSPSHLLEVAAGAPLTPGR